MIDFTQLTLQVSSSTSSLVSLLGPPAAELGGSGLVGYAVGYALKKILKILLIIAGAFIGLELGFLYWLQSIGAVTVTVNYNALSSVGSNAIAWGTSQLGGLVTFAGTITFLGAGFTAGLALGFAKA